MKLTFKDLKQQKFVLEAEPSETIGQLKAKIAAEKGWDASGQKLIYSGKILKDEETVESYKIEEKGFIVCMVQKPKVAPAAAASDSTSTPAKPPSTPAPATISTPAAPLPAFGNTGSNVAATPTPAQGSTTASTGGRDLNDPNALATGGARTEAIAEMESMGFPRSEIDRAMRAAFNNPARAVEYLLTGIPENTTQDNAPPADSGPTAPAAAAPQQTTTTSTTNPTEDADAPINLFEAAAQAGRGPSGGRSTGARGATAATGDDATAAAAGSLDFLRNNPQFQQLRQIVQTQPQMLEPILQQVGAGNPQLAQMINANPDQFLQLLAEDADENAPLPPGLHSVPVTEEEREAIERLCLLGFERDLVIQAYFACEKNEELAANFLFEQPEDDDGA
ncbi:MAG: hypothetical protein GOMPHAMPRED_007564 [Gomphillus americanus]|uniref:UV excision repair protein RAD23 n=1 Tax=Gomphillus americanus TaxID=1940652 RepID=A0A8H3I980_9LECA|nr:MAG: hypothetical protein GOMPHAMPRED_007564 [Gomphillus americanus]